MLREPGEQQDHLAEMEALLAAMTKAQKAPSATPAGGSQPAKSESASLQDSATGGHAVVTIGDEDWDYAPNAERTFQESEEENEGAEVTESNSPFKHGQLNDLHKDINAIRCA